MTTRYIAIPLLLLLATNCKKPTPSTEQPTEQTAPAQLQAPDPVVDASQPVGQKMTWLLELLSSPDVPITTALLEEHFAPLFFAQIPAEKLADILSDTRDQLGRLTPQEPLVVHPHDMTLLATTDAGQKWVVALAVSRQAPHLIEGLFFQPAPRPDLPPPKDFAELDARISELGAHPRALVARIDPEKASCAPIHARSASQPTPLASTFKLYVLLALARQIDAGKLSWDDPLPIRDDLKSLPSGSMQHHAAGTSFPLSTYAESMISISDNTATDHLMVHLGDQVLAEAVKASGHHDPSLLSPMLTTQELFKLKLLTTPEQRDAYAALDATGRRAWRDRELGALRQVALADALEWKGPRHIDSLEWFATAEDICALHATFARHADKPAYARALEIMAMQNAGIGLDDMAYVGYKGGAEPGVLTMSWLLRDTEGQWTSVMLALEGTIPGIDEGELVGLGRAAAQLARTQKTP